MAGGVLSAMSYMGNIPVPGCVTSVRKRDSFKQEKQRLAKKKEEEDKRQQELKKSQEEVLKFMKMKQKQGDAPGSGSRRFREEGYDGESDPKRARRGDDRDYRRGEYRDGDHRDRRQRDSYGNDGYGRRRDASDSRSPRRRDDSYGRSDDEGENRGTWESVEVKDTVRKSRLASAFAVGVGPKDDDDGAAEKQKALESKKKRAEDDKKRKAKLSGAFGLEDDDDEDDDARRNLEFAAAAAAKRAASKRSMISVSGGSSAPSSSGGGGGGGGAGGNLDTYAALKAMADFKRQCNGATKPIPPELKALVMQVSRHSG